MQLAGDVFYDGRLHLIAVFKIRKCVTSFFKGSLLSLCAFLPLPLSRTHRFTSNLLLPYYCPIIFMQMLILNYCSCYCFLKSNHHFSGVSQGSPRRLFVVLQETLFEHPSLISSVIKCVTRTGPGFFMLIISERPNLNAKR